MKRSNNLLTLLLMTSSILLLLILQFFWLRGSYEKAFQDLRRESNILFRNTVFTLRDSALIKNIETIPGDSGLTKEKDIRTFPPDSVIKYFNLREKNSTIQVFISSDGTKNRDSITTVLKPMVNRFHLGRFAGHNSFIVRLGPDTISIDTAQHNYKIALTKAEIGLPFKIKLFKDDPLDLPRRDRFIEEGEPEERTRRQHPFGDSLRTDFVRINPLHRYTASFGNVRGFIIKAITPQILFSLFLTLITSTAFILLYRSIRSQQRLMDLKNDFISNMTHELKTPIATVSVALEALKNFKGIDNPKLTSEYLDIAQHELNRLTLLTDKVLKTSLFENHGVEFIPESVNLELITEQVLRGMSLVFEKQKAVVVFEKKGADFTIKGSEVHLTNVIYNLLDNALKYSASNPSLLITLQGKEDKIVLSIKDNGIGIAPEFQSKIFEKFFRVPSGDVHNTKGYGLGLNYVDNVVKSHKGKIEVKSEEGKGSTFIVTLPARMITHG